MDTGVGIVEPKRLKLELPEGELRLAYGGVLKEVEVAYEECGAPMTDDNVVYICHALTGDAHVAGIRPGETKPSGWWEGMVGPGRAIDTNRYHVVCANVLGGCSGTTGPMSINPDTGRPYGSSFPRYSFDDAVDVFRMLLAQIGVKRLAALIGGSYGGMQAVNWATRFPDDMDRLILVATSPSLNTQALAFDVMGKNAITENPLWKNGDYYLDGDGKGPKNGLASARQLAHISYLSREHLQGKFDRRLQENFVNAPAAERAERDRLFKTYFQIESYLDYQAKKFIDRFDANSYLHIVGSMDEADPAKAYGSLDAAFARVKAKCLVVSYGGDVLFTEWQSREMVASLMKAGKDVSYCHLDYGIGHDAFLTHIDELSKLVGGFLSSREVKVMKWQERLYANIVRMVRVEIEVEKFEEALADGHNVLYDDVDDDGIDMIPDRHYSTAIVSDTLQEVRNPRGLLHEALRIADEAIVTFPNFAAYRIRLTLMFKGRLPVSKQLPFEWYDTPNIHLITLKDFQALCDKEGIEIVETRAESRHPLGRIMLLLGMKNLGASKIIAKVRKRA